jgi:hypothetical protein
MFGARHVPNTIPRSTVRASALSHVPGRHAGWPVGRPTDGQAAGGSVSGPACVATCMGACLRACLPSCLLACELAHSLACFLSCRIGCVCALLPTRISLTCFAQLACRLFSLLVPGLARKLPDCPNGSSCVCASSGACYAACPRCRRACWPACSFPACRHAALRAGLHAGALACWLRKGGYNLIFSFALACVLAAVLIGCVLLACLRTSSFDEMLAQIVMPARRGSWCAYLPIQFATGPSGSDSLLG